MGLQTLRRVIEHGAEQSLNSLAMGVKLGEVKWGAALRRCLAGYGHPLCHDVTLDQPLSDSPEVKASDEDGGGGGFRISTGWVIIASPSSTT
ncbi:hypothetical protein VI26_11860 [Chromobacterium sp. LK1]|uniref:hypothetical protein n=1 Tax=Chromobacterium sp. LK1 TaxID=1628193 RepID=UPI0006546D22|nr:hypothetical protein [Chromobacterium sp. LK1]KMN35347.1 hypothetical protein VI26_11860 [Chromobacterium sp. LK1]